MKTRIFTFFLAYCLPGVLSATNKMVSVNTNCTKDLLQIDLFLGHPFKGIIFAKDFSEECGSKGLLLINIIYILILTNKHAFVYLIKVILQTI